MSTGSATLAPPPARPAVQTVGEQKRELTDPSAGQVPSGSDMTPPSPPAPRREEAALREQLLDANLPDPGIDLRRVCIAAPSGAKIIVPTLEDVGRAQSLMRDLGKDCTVVYNKRLTAPLYRIPVIQ